MTPLTKAREISRSALISLQPLTLSVITYYLGAYSTHLALLTFTTLDSVLSHKSSAIYINLWFQLSMDDSVPWCSSRLRARADTVFNLHSTGSISHIILWITPPTVC